MSMNVIRCASCGGALALADERCSACGEAVPPAQRAAVLGGRAEAQAEAGNYDQAVRAAGSVLDLPLDGREAKLWRRKRANWLQRSGRPGALDSAEADLRQAMALDDGDDLGHQLWVDLLHRQGRLDVARLEYGRRLERDPEDPVAKRHFAALKLMDDLRTAPVPTLNLPPEKQGFFMRLLRPTPGKMVTAAFAAISCLVAFIGALGKHGDALPAGLEGMGPIAQLLMDPWLNALQFVLYTAYLYWGWSSRHDG